MDNERIINSIQVSEKETINLYTSFFTVSTKKTFLRKNKEYKYSDIKYIKLTLFDGKVYVKTEGLYSSLVITMKSKIELTFEFYVYNVKDFKFQTSKVVAFVGSLKASINALEAESIEKFGEPEIEIVEPEETRYKDMLQLTSTAIEKK